MHNFDPIVDGKKDLKVQYMNGPNKYTNEM